MILSVSIWTEIPNICNSTKQRKYLYAISVRNEANHKILILLRMNIWSDPLYEYIYMYVKTYIYIYNYINIILYISFLVLFNKFIKLFIRILKVINFYFCNKMLLLFYLIFGIYDLFTNFNLFLRIESDIRSKI